MYKEYKSDQIAQTVQAKLTAGRLRGRASRNTVGSWRDVLMAVAERNLWPGERRENREPWKGFLKKAEQLLNAPRKPLPQDVVDAVVMGDLGDTCPESISSTKRRVIVFISSTFTDTKAERNSLMRDVYPYMRTLCRKLGLDFGSVDMRWGVNEDITLEHGTAEVCIREINRCIQESAGPAFVCLLSHKYGYRPFPPEIESKEFELMLTALKNKGRDTSLLLEYFQVDSNSTPESYVLKPRTAEQKDWWDIFEKMQVLLREAADEVLSKEEASKYYISVTEQEIKTGIFENPLSSSQSIVITRDLKGVQKPEHVHRHLIDAKGKEIDSEAQEMMRELRERKIPEALHESPSLSFEYEVNKVGNVEEGVKEVCDSLCQKLVEGVFENYAEHLHVEENALFHEILHHRNVVIEKCSLFVGREKLVDRILSYGSSSKRNILVVHGPSGCGKTALMAKCAQQIRRSNPKAILVTRFLGTSQFSGSARALLMTICNQLSQALRQPPVSQSMTYDGLIILFHSLLKLATSDVPITLILDSLDQLSNEDFGKNLKWLCLRDELPDHVKISVSTLPGQCLDILHSFLPNENFIEVTEMEADEGEKMLDVMLESQGRTLTPAQKVFFLKAYRQCPLPLYLKLATDVAMMWHSYDTPNEDVLPTTISGLIEALFDRLESKFGHKFVSHALGCITAAKSGLSAAELEDILSCDDEVLDEIYTFWVPPFRRLPPLLWIRVKNDLGMYLVERGVDDITAYRWYHRQFWEAATRRYLCKNEKQIRGAIADYFEGKWHNGKPYQPPANSKHYKNTDTRLEDRQLLNQPLVIAGDRSSARKINNHKLRELSYQLLKIKDWERFQTQVMKLEFIEAKFESRQGFECLSECIEASKDSQNKLIEKCAKFIGANLSHLIRSPQSVYQLASQQVGSHPMKHLSDIFSTDSLPQAIVFDQRPIEIEDPCEMTLQGHTNGVRMCRYSPQGDLIVSAAEDASLRVWDAFSGAEIMQVANLPGPNRPTLADPYHGERPICFSGDGRLVATGSEDGWLQVWDLTGAQAHSAKSHSTGITGLSYSPDNSTIASCSKDKTVKFWCASSYKLKYHVTLSGEALSLSYSPDGHKLAVSMHNVGLAMINPHKPAVISQATGYCNMNICCAYSPRGDVVATGGDDSKVTLWNAINGKAFDRLTGHKGWIWGITFNKNAKVLISCSSDRTLKVWNMDSKTLIASLGGHTHRVCWPSIHPIHEEKFVTCSLDFSLKVWDMEAVLTGQVPPIGGLHYVLLVGSADCQYYASSQGWSTSYTVFITDSDTKLCEGAAHSGFLAAVAFFPDSSAIISIDHGHNGDYSAGAVYKASAKVFNLKDKSCSELSVHGPKIVAVATEYFVIGTADAKIEIFQYRDNSHCHTIDTKESPGMDDLLLACCHENRIYTSSKHHIHVWKLRDDHSAHEAVGVVGITEAPISRTTLSPDGSLLACGSLSGEISIWNSSSLVQLHTLKRHYSHIKALLFSPDGQHLVSAAVEMQTCIWTTKENNVQLKSSWYGPTNDIAFATDNVVIVGEATGNKRRLEFRV